MFRTFGRRKRIGFEWKCETILYTAHFTNFWEPPESKHMHTIPSVIRHDNFNEVDSFEGLYRIEGPGVLFYFCFLNMSRKTPPLRVFALDNVCQLASPISPIKFRTQLNSGLSWGWNRVLTLPSCTRIEYEPRSPNWAWTRQSGPRSGRWGQLCSICPSKIFLIG